MAADCEGCRKEKSGRCLVKRIVERATGCLKPNRSVGLQQRLLMAFYELRNMLLDDSSPMHELCNLLTHSQADSESLGMTRLRGR